MSNTPGDVPESAQVSVSQLPFGRQIGFSVTLGGSLKALPANPDCAMPPSGG
jgi:hypothetical protein